MLSSAVFVKLERRCTGGMPMPQGSLGRRMIHLNLDDAWGEGVLGMACVDARLWGPRVRYFAPRRLLAEFYQSVLKELPPFVVYGSGDFHHLTGWLVRRVAEPVTLVSFDNHPDWDVRPP